MLPSHKDASLRSIGGAVCIIALALVVNVPVAHATFPGKNGKIAFTDGVVEPPDGTINTEIFSVKRDGTSLARLTVDPALDVQPAWSPDGSKIAFASDRVKGSGGTDIYVMDADGSNVNRLTTGGIESHSPAWSPDGTRIAFTRWDVGDLGSDIWVMNADGSRQTDLTQTAGGGSHAVSWSPDGTRIAFVSDRGGDGDNQIYTMDPDGGNPTKLTTNAANVLSLDWSPDGTQIVFEQDIGDPFHRIYLMQADGTRPRLLMDGLNPAWGRNPAWSPNGTRIVFSYAFGGLTTIAPDGTGSTPVLLFPYSGDDGDWQRLPPPPPDTTPPDAPRSLSAEGADREVVLSWANNTEADFDHYVVYRAPTAGGPSTRINLSAISAARYTDAGVANGTTYFYAVRGVDQSGNASVDSAEASATPIAPPQAEVSERAVELVSTGTKPDTGQFGARLLGTTSDGHKAFFATREQLVAADTNGSLDIYMRTSGSTTLISTGPTGRSGGVSEHRPPDSEWTIGARDFGLTPDGERVFFVTDAALVAADTDTNVDVYERSGDHTALVSTGATARCVTPDGCNAYFAHVSGGGARVVFITEEGLVPEDTDGVCPAFDGNVPCADVYERSFGTTKLVSFGSLGGSGASPESSIAFFEGASADGTRIYFSTSERLEPEDTDTACDGDVLYPDCIDVYERSDGTTKLVSPGPAGGDTNANQLFGFVSDDGRRTFLWTWAPLLAEDTDGDTDLYEHSPSGTALISDGLDIADVPLMRTVFTPDGSVFFDALAPLTQEDADTQRDVYSRIDGTTTLISAGASGDGALPARLAGISRDGSSVFFETEEHLTAADADDYRDVYRSSGSRTTLMSGSGEFGPGASFLGASADGSRVFFKTAESLSSADADSSEDIYESFIGKITLLSRGGAPSATDFGIELAGMSDDGSDVYFLSDERLVAADQDNVGDVYVARIATDPPPPTAAPPAPVKPTPVTSLSLRLDVGARYRIRALLRGLVVPVRCSEPCTATLRLSLGRRPARRLGLISTKDFVLSRRTGQVAAGKRSFIRLRLSKRSVRRLRRARILRLKLVAVATDTNGRRTTVTRRIVGGR